MVSGDLMDPSFDAPLAAFARFREPEPADLVASLRGLPEPGVDMSFIGLVP
jgi:hypothetical protein